MKFRRIAGCIAVLAMSVSVDKGAAGKARQSQPAARQADYCAVTSTVRPSLPAVLMDGIGSARFPITTSSPEAQRFFNQGLAQLHAFWFVEAERSFLQASKLDPNAPMAFWGIAASAAGDSLPAFQLPRRSNQGQAPPPAGSPEARAREAIASGTALRDRATGRERAYIDAQAARRNSTARDPDGAYVQAMRTLAAVYPEDLHAKALLALALENGYHPATREARPGTREALTLLREVLAKDADHAGAHHYIIHGYEGGPEMEAAVESCRRLPQLVPKIPHALHMPGHIYVQTNRWDEAIRAFEASASSELGYMKRDALYPAAHYSHNQHFLAHVLGVEGRFREAMRRAEEMLQIKENPRERAAPNGTSVYRDGWFVRMKTLVRFEKWDQILDGKTLPRYERHRESAWYHFARGLAMATRNGPDRATEEYVSMRESMDELQQSSGWVPMALGVAMIELEGYIQVRAGNWNRGISALGRAVQMEETMPYAEPPAYPRPVRELLGQLFLSRQDYRAAEDVFRDLLREEPGSGRALWGLAQALAGSGKAAEAEQIRRQFEAAWATADRDLPELRTRPSGRSGR